MTSQEIKEALDATEAKLKAGGKPSHPYGFPLWEIAFQLAEMKEQAQKRHEENLQQRDAFLLADPPANESDDVGEPGEILSAAAWRRLYDGAIRQRDFLRSELARFRKADIENSPFQKIQQRPPHVDPRPTELDQPQENQKPAQPQWTAGGSIQGTE